MIKHLLTGIDTSIAGSAYQVPRTVCSPDNAAPWSRGLGATAAYWQAHCAQTPCPRNRPIARTVTPGTSTPPDSFHIPPWTIACDSKTRTGYFLLANYHEFSTVNILTALSSHHHPTRYILWELLYRPCRNPLLCSIVLVREWFSPICTGSPSSS